MKVLGVLVALLIPLSAGAAELKVLSGNGPKAAVRALCAEFEKKTGTKIDLRFGVNPEVKKKIESGETFDVVIGNPPIVEALVKDKLVLSSTDFGRAGLGLAVKSGAPKPDLSSVASFKQALLNTKSVAFPGKGASGIYFVSLLDRIGIKDAMQSKLKPKEAEDTVEVVARGEADMVVVVATRIVDVPGVDYVGPIPSELQTHIGFAAGLSASAKQPDAGKALIAFFKTPAAVAILKAKGVEPVP